MKRKKAKEAHEAENLLLLNVGYGNYVSIQKLVTILSADSSPVKRVVQEAKDKGILIDATYGRRTRSVLIMDSGHVVLSAIQPDTMSHRFLGNHNNSHKENETLTEQAPKTS